MRKKKGVRKRVEEAKAITKGGKAKAEDQKGKQEQEKDKTTTCLH